MTNQLVFERRDRNFHQEAKGKRRPRRAESTANVEVAKGGGMGRPE